MRTLRNNPGPFVAPVNLTKENAALREEVQKLREKLIGHRSPPELEYPACKCKKPQFVRTTATMTNKICLECSGS